MAEQMLCFREGLFAELALLVKYLPRATWWIFADARDCATPSGAESRR